MTELRWAAVVGGALWAAVIGLFVAAVVREWRRRK